MFVVEEKAEEEGDGEAVWILDRRVSGATWWRTGQRQSAPPTDDKDSHGASVVLVPWQRDECRVYLRVHLYWSESDFFLLIFVAAAVTVV